MSGEVSGLQQLIPETQTLVLYTHCTGHVLNLDPALSLIFATVLHPSR